jgi:predicted negative regulator of RcsB-dependent stress response
MKLSTPKLSLPKFVNKTVLLVSLAVLVVLGLVAYGAVRQVQATKAAEVSAQQAAADRKAQAAEVQAKIATLETQNKALESSKLERDLACSELKRLDANRAITLAVTVPAYCLK